MELQAALQPPIARKRSLPIAFAFLLVAILAVFAPFLPAVSRVVLTAVNVALVLAYLMLRRQPTRVDYLEVIIPYSILHILYFGVGSLYLSFQPKALHPISLEPFLTPALALGLLGFSAFLLAYTFCFTGTKPSRAHGLVPGGAFACVLPAMLGLTAYVAGSERYRAMFADLDLTAVVSLFSHFAPFFWFAWFLTWVVFWSAPRRTANRVLLVMVSIIAVGMVFLTLGSKELGITIIAMPALAFGYVRRKFPVKSFVVLVLLLVFVIFPIYNTYRTQDASFNTTERLQTSVRQAKEWRTRDYLDHSLFAFFSRISVVTSVAVVLRDAGRWVDYANGRTILLAPIGLLIPRFLWPEKPVLNVGREFGERFRLIGVADEETNIAPTMIGELYWNFQIPAVILGMLLLGAGYRWLYERYGRDHGLDPVRRSIYMALLPGLLHSEGSIALTFGSIVEGIVLLSLLVFLFKRMGVLVPARTIS